MGGTNAAVDGIARFEVESLDLRWGNIDVVRAWQVVVIQGSQKTKAFRQRFEDAFTPDFAAQSGLMLQNFVDEFLSAQVGCIFDLHLDSFGEKFRDMHAFDLFDLHNKTCLICVKARLYPRYERDTELLFWFIIRDFELKSSYCLLLLVS